MGADCVTDPQQIHDYLSDIKVAMVWFDSYIAEDSTHETSTYYED